MKKTVFTTLMMILAAASLSSCSGNKASSSSYTLPSTDPGSGGGSGGTVSSTGIMVNVLQVDQPVVSYLHQFNNFNLPCMIPSSAAANQDIKCLLNMQELDLYHQGLKFEFNVPKGMCEFIGEIPYSYYNLPAGYGPSTISMTVDKSGGPSSCSVTNRAGNPITASVVGGVCTFTGGTAKVDGTTTCAYDYTNGDGPNCCEGKVNFSGTTIPTTGDPETVNIPKKEWGGLLGNCVASPAKSTASGWSIDSKYNTPVPIIYNGKNGLNKTYQVTAPIKFRSASNRYVANMWGWSNYVTSTHSAATPPTAMTYSTDVFGNSLPNFVSQSAFPGFSNKEYGFACLNSAFNVVHKVRIYVNEWDKQLDFLNYGASSGSTANSPINNGNCDGTVGDCNNMGSWADSPGAFPNDDIVPRQ